MNKYPLDLESPLLNSGGTLGFAPTRNCPIDLHKLGAYVTNPLSLEPRRPARGIRMRTFPGGFLLHTGYPNPGMRIVLRRFASRWAGMPIPVIVHILARTAEEVYQMVLALEAVEGVIGLELGLPPDLTTADLPAWVRAGRGEQPLIFRLPFEKSSAFGEILMNEGAEWVSLSPPRGGLPGPNGSLIQGRLYGPAVLPLMLPVVQKLSHFGLSVMAGGGVYTPEDSLAVRNAGAKAVQLDAVLWRGDIPDLTAHDQVES